MNSPIMNTVHDSQVSLVTSLRLCDDIAQNLGVAVNFLRKQTESGCFSSVLANLCLHWHRLLSYLAECLTQSL